MDTLPGDPVPGYEKPRTSYTQKDVDELSRLLLAREQENKKTPALSSGPSARP
jgi:hypothetical protein